MVVCREKRRLEKGNEILRHAAAYSASPTFPKRATRWSVTYPAESFPVRLTCGALGFSTQAFYAWSRNPVLLQNLEDA